MTTVTTRSPKFLAFRLIGSSSPSLGGLAQYNLNPAQGGHKRERESEDFDGCGPQEEMAFLTPSPACGEGWGEGSESCSSFAHDLGSSQVENGWLSTRPSLYKRTVVRRIAAHCKYTATGKVAMWQ